MKSVRIKPKKKQKKVAGFHIQRVRLSLKNQNCLAWRFFRRFLQTTRKNGVGTRKKKGKKTVTFRRVDCLDRDKSVKVRLTAGCSEVLRKFWFCLLFAVFELFSISAVGGCNFHRGDRIFQNYPKHRPTIILL